MDGSSTPLADYFWIAGIDSIGSFDDDPQPSPQQLDETIAEDGEAEAEAVDDSVNASSSRRTPARHSRQISANRLSKTSNDARISLHSLDGLDGSTQSNRSSATIRPSAPPNGSGNGQAADGPPADFDFDRALIKFAIERENFLDDLNFSAGAKVEARTPMTNPRAERLKVDDGDAGGRKSPLKGISGSIRGSIRRKMSIRDMNSSRKQPAAQKASRSGTPYPSGLHYRCGMLTGVVVSLREDRQATQQL